MLIEHGFRSIAGLFATTKGGVPKPRVEFLEVTTLGIETRLSVIRSTMVVLKKQYVSQF